MSIHLYLDLAAPRPVWTRAEERLTRVVSAVAASTPATPDVVGRRLGVPADRAAALLEEAAAAGLVRRSAHHILTRAGAARHARGALRAEPPALSPRPSPAQPTTQQQTSGVGTDGEPNRGGGTSMETAR